jgi:hypothetical protein
MTIKDDSDNLKVIANDISYMKRDISDIKRTVQHSYVTKDEFEPIKNIVYGLVGLILVSVVGALVSLVMR